ncbi:MAG: TIGR04283 family arsenosugar biosynthesis glycosyltransferase [Nitrospirae bacterium]|nr:TIGR04283 family arsenosugar biosynthesis glycosyltransferase [Nitrospirota bacterium]
MISIIIPALNEEFQILRCIDSIRAEDFSGEIIVADGNSADRTRELALSRTGVMVIASPRGRGAQMNAGAAAATGATLLFLHADTLLEQGWSAELFSFFGDPSVVGGAFRFSIDNPSPKYRLVEAWVHMRCRLFRLPYGDQAIFIRRSVFRDLGGFKEMALMEDVDIVRRMKKQGKLVMLKRRAVTSGRRWVSKGLLKTAAINQMTMLLYQLGVSPDKLARFYYR